MYYARAMRNRGEDCLGNPQFFFCLTIGQASPSPECSWENATVLRLFCYQNRICHFSSISATATYDFFTLIQSDFSLGVLAPLLFTCKTRPKPDLFHTEKGGGPYDPGAEANKTE